jgi:molybdate transport system substrate-binding protein
MNFLSRVALLLLFSTFFSPMKADDLTVFAAASLTDALKEIATGYEKTSGDKIAFNFAASGTLELQIRHGAPADIFFSADEAKMNDLQKDGLLLAESRKDLLGNLLVVIVPSESSLTLTSAAQLADAKVKRIALGETHIVPAGIYAEAYLKKIEIWDQVQARVVPLESVRAALAAVETGNADAGIVYKTDALHSKKVKIAYEVPAQDGPAIIYPAGVVKDSKHAAAAQKFLDDLGAPEAQAVFQKYGFLSKAGAKSDDGKKLTRTRLGVTRMLTRSG